MKEYFRKVNVKLEMTPELKYGDYRDWFIIDPNKPVKIHETEIKFYINGEFIYKDMMPINIKTIKYVIESNVNYEMLVESIKWEIPEMDWKKETTFPNPTMVTHFDTLTVDGTIDFTMGEK